MKNLLGVICVSILVGVTGSANAEKCQVRDQDISATFKGGCKDGLAEGKGTAKGKDVFVGIFHEGDKVKGNGAYYLWTRKEFDTVVGNEQESEIAAAYWNVREYGNVDREYDPHDEFLYRH